MLGIAFQRAPLRHSVAARRIAVGFVVAVIVACAMAVANAAPAAPSPRPAVAAPASPSSPVSLVALSDDNDPNDTSFLYYYAGMCQILTPWSYWWYFWDCLNREGIPPAALVFEDVISDDQPDGTLLITVHREFSDGHVSEFTRHIPARRSHGAR